MYGQMIEKNICLLLGAGASSHLGFPLGEGLKNSILLELDQMRKSDLSRYPEGIRDSGEDLDEFYERLHMGDWNSPDAFLEDYPQFMNTGKYLICKQLAEKEHQSDFIGKIGWYKHLINAIRVDDLDDLKHNRLSIVTFNYDRSIDHRLHGYVKAKSKSRDDEEAWQIVKESFEIIHLHGSLGEYPKYKYGSTDDIYARSQDIKIISEVEVEERSDGYVNDTFKRASECLMFTDRVVVLGFGFAKDNVKRLKYFQEKKVDKSSFNRGRDFNKLPEERDIIIAMGNQNLVYKKSTEEWMKQWGLREKTHFRSADDLFDNELNPFIF